MEDFLLKILPICVCSKAVVFFATETISGPCCNATALMQDPEIVSFTKTILRALLMLRSVALMQDPWNCLVYRDNFRDLVNATGSINASP